MPTEIIERLATDSNVRLQELRSQLSNRLTKALPNDISSALVIYATGSLARLEANPHSDLDAFFYVLGSKKECIKPMHEIRTFYEVMEAAKATDFPDFSGGGKFLHFQYFDDVINNIGSREDDYINGFTSRMLLILEGSSLFNDSSFKDSRRKLIDHYFLDFPDHSENFKPIFLLNDILRFWRTLCINYEHRRSWGSEIREARAEGHLNNLKLRYSRLFMCYSFVVALMNCDAPLSADQVETICAQTPMQRLEALRPQNDSIVAQVRNSYEWFLSAMDAPKPDVLKWILDEPSRNDAFDRSRAFAADMFSLVSDAAGRHGYSRFLVM